MTETSIRKPSFLQNLDDWTISNVLASEMIGTGINNNISNNNNNNNNNNNWRDITRSIQKMDALYDASFLPWIKNEQNISVAAGHIKRIMSEYPEDRVSHGLRWLISDWTLGSITNFVKQVFLQDFWQVATTNNPDHKTSTLFVLGNVRYARKKEDMLTNIRLISRLTQGWDIKYVAEMLANVVPEWPLRDQKKFFLENFMHGWTFQRVSDLFIYVGAHIEWDIKVELLKIFSKASSATVTKDHSKMSVASMKKHSINNHNFPYIGAGAGAGAVNHEQPPVHHRVQRNSSFAAVTSTTLDNNAHQGRSNSISSLHGRANGTLSINTGIGRTTISTTTNNNNLEPIRETESTINNNSSSSSSLEPILETIAFPVNLSRSNSDNSNRAEIGQYVHRSPVSTVSTVSTVSSASIPNQSVISMYPSPVLETPATPFITTLNTPRTYGNNLSYYLRSRNNSIVSVNGNEDAGNFTHTTSSTMQRLNSHGTNDGITLSTSSTSSSTSLSYSRRNSVSSCSNNNIDPSGFRRRRSSCATVSTDRTAGNLEEVILVQQDDQVEDENNFSHDSARKMSGIQV